MSVLNFHLVTKQELPLKRVLESLHSNFDLHVNVDRLYSIKNWQWEEERRLNSPNEISNALLHKRIVVVYFDVKGVRNFGVHIERKGTVYIYSFWWDANRIAICYRNGEEFLRHLSAAAILDRLAFVISECCMDFVSIAFGEETVYDYSQCTQKMVESSHNVILWLFKGNDVPSDFPSLQKISDIACLNASLFISC